MEKAIYKAKKGREIRNFKIFSPQREDTYNVNGK
jgi:hypothetical protein